MPKVNFEEVQALVEQLNRAVLALTGNHVQKAHKDGATAAEVADLARAAREVTAAFCDLAFVRLGRERA